MSLRNLIGHFYDFKIEDPDLQIVEEDKIVELNDTIQELNVKEGGIQELNESLQELKKSKR